MPIYQLDPSSLQAVYNDLQRVANTCRDDDLISGQPIGLADSYISACDLANLNKVEREKLGIQLKEAKKQCQKAMVGPDSDCPGKKGNPCVKAQVMKYLEMRQNSVVDCMAGLDCKRNEPSCPKGGGGLGGGVTSGRCNETEVRPPRPEPCLDAYCAPPGGMRPTM